MQVRSSEMILTQYYLAQHTGTISSITPSLSLSLSVTCPAATLFCSVKPPTKPPRLLCEQLMHRAEKLIERKTDPWECLFVRPPQAAASVLPRRILSTVQHGEYLLYALL